MRNKYQRMILVMLQILRKIPFYLHTKSNHIFTLHQHVIILVLRQYEPKSYESFVEMLEASSGLVLMLGLSRIPHFYNTAKGGVKTGQFHAASGSRQVHRYHMPGQNFAGVDATGFEDGHAASYYTYR